MIYLMLENHSSKSAYCILLFLQSALIDISYHNICRTGDHSHTVRYRKTAFFPYFFSSAGFAASALACFSSSRTSAAR